MSIFSPITNLFRSNSVPPNTTSVYSSVAQVEVGTHERMTPTELYDEFKKGERFEYYTLDYGSDASYSVLSNIVGSYLKKPTKEGKEKLLKQEEDILYEELMNPELTLARNYLGVANLIDEKSTPEEIEARITLFNLSGLHRLENYKLGNGLVKYDDEKVELLKKIYKDADESNIVGQEIKRAASGVIQFMISDSKLDKDKKREISKFMIENTSNQDIIDRFPITRDCSDEIESLNENPEQYDKLREVLLLSEKENKDDVRDLVENILTEDNSSDEIKKLAVWGAGKYRSDRSFEIIKKIALDKDEKNITLREFAIQSSALYLRDKTDEVIDMMDTISNDGTIFAPLGKILKDKVTGNYHNQKDRELNYSTLTDEEKKYLKRHVKKKIKFDKKLNQQRTNNMYRDLRYFSDVIQEYPGAFQRTYILDGTHTTIDKKTAGKRVFPPHAPLISGFFSDTRIGTANSVRVTLANWLLKSNERSSVVAHEYAHKLNDVFDEKDKIMQKNLYGKALKENSFISDYAKTNEKEYFAVGMDAYVKPYEPHKYLLYKERVSRYALMEKDPELYKFIEGVFDKYSAPKDRGFSASVF